MKLPDPLPANPTPVEDLAYRLGKHEWMVFEYMSSARVYCASGEIPGMRAALREARRCATHCRYLRGRIIEIMHEEAGG